MEAPAYHHLVTDTGTRDTLNWEIDGIRLGHAISKFHTITEFTAASAMTDVVRLHIGMRGNYSFQYRQLNTTFDLIGGHHNILYSRDFEMTVHNRTLELETFGVQFPKTTFLLSKSIELLVCCAESCDRATHNKTPNPILKSNTDKEKILAARDLVNARIDTPPSLSEIARTVGLNEYKLKRGFRETFSTTVFGYLTAQRLLLARRYLLDTHKTAAEIAFELGYSTPQHFNNAFKKHFGHTPDSIRPGRREARSDRDAKR